VPFSKPIESQSKTPAYAFVVALISGILVPVAAGLALQAFVFFGNPAEETGALAVIAMILLVTPLFYYVAGYVFGYKWPMASPWAWTACIFAALAITALVKSGVLLGFIFFWHPTLVRKLI
jgi:hypothetical protein